VVIPTVSRRTETPQKDIRNLRPAPSPLQEPETVRDCISRYIFQRPTFNLHVGMYCQCEFFQPLLFLAVPIPLRVHPRLLKLIRSYYLSGPSSLTYALCIGRRQAPYLFHPVFISWCLSLKPQFIDFDNLSSSIERSTSQSWHSISLSAFTCQYPQALSFKLAAVAWLMMERNGSERETLMS
jgi:hypothetical protein